MNRTYAFIAVFAGVAVAAPAFAQTAAPDSLGASQVKALQQSLSEHGFSVGKVDGKWGPATEAALKRFQGKDGLAVDGEPNGPTMAKLGLQSPGSAGVTTAMSSTPATQLTAAVIPEPAPSEPHPTTMAATPTPPASANTQLAQNTTTTPASPGPAPATTGVGSGIGTQTDRTLGTNMTGNNPGGANAGKNAAGGNNNQAVTTTTANATQPAHGSNSFTQGEAQGRIGSDGYQNVSALKLDNNGVWRGTASKNGQQMQVWLDYKGNVGHQ